MLQVAKCCSMWQPWLTMANYRTANSANNKPVPAWLLTPTKKTRVTLCCGNCRVRNEPGWDSPWGRGRPGWHIECSVMSKHHLGEVFDIHGGGLDLIFPHHENEIAQSRCAHGTKVMANYWMHNGFLQVEGKKMSKSDGNFYTIQQLLSSNDFGGRSWPGEVLRLAMLTTHYTQPIDWTVVALNSTMETLQQWDDMVWKNLEGMSITAAPPSEGIIEALSNDLNFSGVLKVLHEYS